MCIRDSTGTAGRIFGALGQGGINVIAIAQGSTELNITLVVRDEDDNAALRYIHDELYATGEGKV